MDATNLPTVTAPVTPALPDGWTIEKAISLIDALARNLYDEPYILTQFGLTKAQFAILSANEWFATAVEIARAQWNAADNVHKRLAIEAALVLEKNMPALSKRMGANTEPLAAVAQLAKLFADIAGSVGAKAHEDAPKEKFKIIFNLGADIQSFDKSRPLVQITENTPNDPRPNPQPNFGNIE